MQTSIIAAWFVSLVASTAVGDVPIYNAEDVGTYFRQWLLCGPFALGENLERTDYKHGPRCVGFHRDLLASAGGEAAADPKPGQEILGHGKKHQWFHYASKNDLIPLDEILTPNDLVVGYAFCKIQAGKAGMYILSIGSNDGVKAWLNGQIVHAYHPENGRWLQRDDDYVPVRLRQGLNNLLLKIDEGTGDFGFVVRLLDYDKTLAAIRANLDAYKRLAVVTQDDVACVTFGQPYAISALNPTAKVTVELLDKAQNRLAARSAQPGYEIKFPLADIPDGPITFRATFPVSDRQTLTSQRKHFKGRLPRHPNVKNIKDLATLDETGRPYLPLGMYSVPPSAYQKVKQAGLNFVMGSAVDLDAAQAAGLKVAVGLHGRGNTWINHITKTVTTVRSHPGLLCWMMFDEPGYNKADLLDIHAAYNALYKLDNIHPSYLVITAGNVYETFGRCCDVLAIDTYPVSRGNYSAVPKSIQRAYEVSDGDQPVWHCGQLFAWPRDRPPTPHEHRYMTYAALIAGAKAFLWYAYRHAGWTLPEDDAVLWNAHVRLLAELNDVAPVIVAPGRGKKVNIVNGQDSIRAVIKSDSNRIFLFAANDARTKSVKCTFLLPPGDHSDIKVYGQNRTVTANGNKFSDIFRPLDVHVYQLN